MTRPATRLAEGVQRFQSPQWQTNSLVVLRDGHSLVVDPAWTPAEIHDIHAVAAVAQGERHFVLRRRGFRPHLRMEAFRDARIHVESRSAALIDEGLSGRFLHDTGAEWGLDFPFEPHYDEVFEVGAELSLGPFRIATLDAAGHMLDGAAYVLIDEGILVPGDNLCRSGPRSSSGRSRRPPRPSSGCSARSSATTCHGWFPGTAMCSAPARRARSACRISSTWGRSGRRRRRRGTHGLAWAEALVRLMTVKAPRPNGPDIEIYTPSYLAARRVLIDVGFLRPGETPPRIGLRRRR